MEHCDGHRSLGLPRIISMATNYWYGQESLRRQQMIWLATDHLEEFTVVVNILFNNSGIPF